MPSERFMRHHYGAAGPLGPYRAGGFRATAKATVIDGIRFPSKAEAKRYQDLCLLQKSGDVQWFIRQPSFDLPGGIKYRADYLVVWDSGLVTVEDVKGFRTKEFDLKMRLMKQTYPKVEVLLVGYRGRRAHGRREGSAS